MKMGNKISLGMVLATLMLILLISVTTTPLVSAGDKGSFGYEKTIDVFDVTTWAGVPNATDVAGDHVSSGQVGSDICDILKVAICNNFTHLFVRIDVAGALPEPTPPASTSFAMQLYVEDAAHVETGGTTFFYTDAGPSNISVYYLFSKWSNGGYAAFHWDGTTPWAWDYDLTDPATQGQYNWTVGGNSFAFSIYLPLLYSTGAPTSGDSFKFEILTVWSPDGGPTWIAQDFLDYGTYTLTGAVIPEFPSLAILLITMFIVAIAVVATKKFRPLKLV